MTAATENGTVRSAEEIARLEPLRLGEIPGVRHRVLWHDETSIAGVMTVDAGHQLGRHTHRLNHHHIWVVEGRATILGRELSSGSYVHIPSGVEHDIDASATEGCTFFYLYLAPTTSPG